jgi:hypothetical protein
MEDACCGRRRHQASHVEGEVQLVGILGRDNDRKLMPVAEPGLVEVFRARRSVRCVENTLRAVFLDTIALDVLQMKSSRFRSGGRHAHVVSFDDHAASVVRGRPNGEA